MEHRSDDTIDRSKQTDASSGKAEHSVNREARDILRNNPMKSVVSPQMPTIRSNYTLDENETNE